MRLLAMGDIHGHARALDALLAVVRLGPNDLLVTLGDYVDRGPDSRGVLERLIALESKGRLVAIRGNHDFMMVEARKGILEESEWRQFGGDATLASYAPEQGAGELQHVPGEHWEFLEERCIDWYEAKTHFFVHANVNPDLPLEEQSCFMLHWEKLGQGRPHRSGKVMVCGHTPQKSGRPLNLGHAICLDTWIYGPGWLTCMDVESGEYWQANASGDTRSDRLAEPA